MADHEPGDQDRASGTQELWRRRKEWVHRIVSACPHCALGPPPGSASVIYRLSGSAITMRCNLCSLQWSMTLHRVSEMAKLLATRGGDDAFEGRVYEHVAQLFAVNDPRKGPPLQIFSPRNYDES